MARPAYELVRLDQTWSYFAPEVGLVATDAWFEIDRADGSVDRWDLPNEFPVFGTLRNYRWIKFKEALAFDNELRERIFDHIIRNDAAADTIVSVRLIIALTAPTIGSHGPYDPDYRAETVATREP